LLRLPLNGDGGTGMKLKQSIEKTIIRATRTMSLRGKIVLFYGVIVFIPTVLLAVGAGYVAFHSVRANYLLTIKEAVRQTAQSIEFRKQSYDLLATRTATDGELVSRLSRDYANMTEQLETVKYVDRSFLLTAKYLPGIEDFRIYHSNASLVQDGGLLWKPQDDRMLAGIKESDWYEQAIGSPDILTWSNSRSDARKLVVSRKIMDSYGSVYGVVYALLDYNSVFAEPFNHPFSGAGELYIVDKNERIIASSESGEIGDRLASSSLKRYWGRRNQVSTPIDGKVLIVQTLSGGWSVAALVHIDRMEEQSKRVYEMVGFGVAFFLLLSVFLIMTVLQNIVWRIRKLGVRMNDISQGVFEVTVPNRDRDELGELEVLFNSMSGRLGRLVEENTQASLKEREQAFRSLQAQINPHFIYNSLGLLRWRALDAKDEEQIRIIDALTTFYRLTLNNQITVIRVRDELEHVRAYLDICQFRYPDRVRVEWNVDEAALDCYTIKTVLQPIVENCYQHGGIARRPDARIVLTVAAEGGRLRMSVLDNGLGIPVSVLRELEEGTYRKGGPGGRSGGNGFGIANIRERLALYFGDNASLAIRSEPDAWTLVELDLPASSSPPAIRREMNDA